MHLSILLTWLNATDHQHKQRPSQIVKAGIAYYWIQKSELFGDLSGDIARLLSAIILGENNVSGFMLGLSMTLGDHSQPRVNLLYLAEDNDITLWLLWFFAKVIEAQKRQAAELGFLQSADRLIQRVAAGLNPRQSRALLQIREAGPDGYSRGFTASDHMTITGTSIATATRDLSALLEMDVLLAKGQYKWRRYFLNVPRDPVPVLSIESII
jgi:Fic family protein